MRTALFFAAATLAAHTHATAKDDPVVLEATSQWNINYADDFCRLARTFGEGEQQIILLIDRFSPSESFRLNLIGQMMEKGPGEFEAAIRFGSKLPEQELSFYVGDFGKDKPAWLFAPSVRIRPEAEGARPDEYKPVTFSESDEALVDEIFIGRPLKKPIMLRTGTMKAAFAALRRCTDELLTHWGIDVERHRQTARMVQPVGNPGRWLTTSDYPRDMQQDYQPGLVQFRLIVGENGRPSSCHIQQSTNPEGFNDTVCAALMRRARFKPALDQYGKPIPSYYLNVVRFQP